MCVWNGNEHWQLLLQTKVQSLIEICERDFRIMRSLCGFYAKKRVTFLSFPLEQ